MNNLLGDPLNLISNLGAMGFVLWMSFRLTNHTIPRLATQFEEAVERQRQDFKDILQQQRADMLMMVDRQEKAHQEEVQKLVDSVKELAREMRS